MTNEEILIRSGLFYIDTIGNIYRIKLQRSNKRGSYTVETRKRCERSFSNYKGISAMIDGKEIQCLSHRIVYTYFYGPIPNEKEINHIDGNKQNNNPENLECVSHKENIVHASKTGLLKPVFGNKNPKTKIQDELIHTIIYTYENSDITQAQLAKMYDVSQSTIGRLYKRASRANENTGITT